MAYGKKTYTKKRGKIRKSKKMKMKRRIKRRK